MNDLIRQAIEASLNRNFKKAIKLNKIILKRNKNNIETLNRLGCAYFEVGEIKQAKKFYKRGLALDCYNPIILKNLKKISSLKGKLKKKNLTRVNIKNLFLTEPGKTKLISLVNLPSITNFLHLASGTPIFLNSKKRSIFVYLNNHTDKKKAVYLGTLPDDLSFRLIRLIKKGNQYEACIKSVTCNNLTIFIRETLRSKRLQDQPSF